MSSGFKGNTKIIFHEIAEFIKMIIKQLRSIKLNRNFLVFLVFLGISTSLWLIQTAMETLTTTIEYRVKLDNVPKNIIFTSDIQDTIKVHISVKGSAYYSMMLLHYWHTILGEDDRVIPVEFKDVDCTSSQMIISNIILKRNIQRHLDKEFHVQLVTPSQINAYYTKGKAKRLPIVFDGKLKPGALRVITGISMSPGYAEVYLPYSLYDSVKVVHADCEPLDSIFDPTTVRVALKKIDNVKIMPDSVDLKINVDFWTENKVTVRIYPVNQPENMTIKFFPENVNLTFHAVAKRSRKITPDDFSVVADYNQIKPGDKYCTLVLTGQPDDATNIRFEPQKVQYVIESKNDE